jgi:hypothetical protein
MLIFARKTKISSRAFFSQVQEYVSKRSGKHINAGPSAQNTKEKTFPKFIFLIFLRTELIILGWFKITKPTPIYAKSDFQSIGD